MSATSAIAMSAPCARVHVVVHHRDEALTLSQAELALGLGADGVFLISHVGEDAALPPLAHRIRAMSRPTVLVGMNLLRTPSVQALAIASAAGCSGLWVSNPGVSSVGASAQAHALHRQMELHPRVTVFGCVAFKYQPDEPKPAEAALQALALGMHPTTSGAGTGVAPGLDKIRQMSAACAGRLAVASGMTPDNVAEFAPHVSNILVSTGVSRDEHHLDESRLRTFLAAVRGSAAAQAGGL